MVVRADANLDNRAAPGLAIPVLAVLPAGTNTTIDAGPVVADGFDWSQLGLPGYGPDGRTPGWTASTSVHPGALPPPGAGIGWLVRQVTAAATCRGAAPPWRSARHRCARVVDDDRRRLVGGKQSRG